MNILIRREDKVYGPFTPDEVQQHFGDGSLINTDFASFEGSDNWFPIEEILTGKATPPQLVTEPPQPAKSNTPHLHRSTPQTRTLIGGAVLLMLLVFGSLLSMAVILYYLKHDITENHSPGNPVPTSNPVPTRTDHLGMTDLRTDTDVYFRNKVVTGKDVMFHLENFKEYDNVEIVVTQNDVKTPTLYKSDLLIASVDGLDISIFKRDNIGANEGRLYDYFTDNSFDWDNVFKKYSKVTIGGGLLQLTDSTFPNVDGGVTTIKAHPTLNIQYVIFSN